MKHEIVKVKIGDIVYNEGESDRTMFLIKQGRVKLFNDINGQIIDGPVIFSGGVIGELSFFDGHARESSSKAVMNSVLIAIKFEDMKTQLEAIPAWFTTIINSIVGRVRNTEKNVIKVASKGATMDYTKKDLKSESYTYINKADFLKITTVISMVTAKYSQKGVSSLEINFDALKQFIVRFQLGTSKLEAVLKILEEHEIVKKTELGEGKFRLELLNIPVLESLVKTLSESDNQMDLTGDAVRALNALDVYLKDEPLRGDGTKFSNVVKVQNSILTKEKYFLQAAAFSILEKAGIIRTNKEDGASENKYKSFSFKPQEIEAFLPVQKVLASLASLNKEK